MANSIMFFILLFTESFVYASDYDKALIDTLKIEAYHNIERLKSYKKEKLNNKIFENEREKGLGEYLEEQEKWDLIRERGRQEYRKQKLSEIQDSKAYKLDLKEKAEAQRQYENSRRTYVKTRDKVRSQQVQTISQLESEELEFYMNRPRYEFNKRRKNKWASASSSKPSPGATSSPYQGSVPPPAASDYPPSNQTEFPPAPAPAYEGFEEMPPPPLYDSNIPYDPSFGGEMIPPPPPPPLDYDF